MSTQERLTKINLYDKLNAAFVSLITPEMKKLNKARRQNGIQRIKKSIILGT